jgi:hypothetical protein
MDTNRSSESRNRITTRSSEEKRHVTNNSSHEKHFTVQVCSGRSWLNPAVWGNLGTRRIQTRRDGTNIRQKSVAMENYKQKLHISRDFEGAKKLPEHPYSWVRKFFFWHFQWISWQPTGNMLTVWDNAWHASLIFDSCKISVVRLYLLEMLGGRGGHLPPWRQILADFTCCGR